METITLTINGNTISARAGKTILEVARLHGIPIPTLCHHESLRPIGACRLCQVEDEKRGLVVPACVTTISPGMVIQTDSERVRRNRRNILRLLMAAHPESCVVCEKGNTCELRKLCAEFGLGDPGLDRMAYHPGSEDLNPFMVRDLSKCILCAKCIRADQEVVCEGVIDYNRRGFNAHPATLGQKPLENSACTFCGTCLSVCPVGAIAEKERPRLDHAGRKTLSVCSFCGCGCAIYLKHDGRMVRFVSPTSQKHTANGITMCVKGHFGHDYLISRDRLSSPLVRTDEGFRPVSWDDALTRIADGFSRIVREHGPDALGFMGGARGTNEENYLFQKLARQVVGTNNVDHAGRALWGPMLEALREATGFMAGSTGFAGVEAAGAILVLGADPTRTAPVLGYHIKRAVRYGGRKLIVVDPVRTKLAGLADLWLRPRVGGDRALLLGLLKAIHEEDLWDREFVATKTVGFEALEAVLAGIQVPAMAASAGVPENDLRQAARLFASAQSGVVVIGGGLAGQPDAADLGKLTADLVLMTGNLGKDHSGWLPVLKDANAQGALDMGLAPDRLPGGLAVNDPDAAIRLAGLWGDPAPAKPGLDQMGMLAAAREGRIKGLYIFGENTLAAAPDGLLAREALEKTEFLVVQDLFLTETAKAAHVVLPSTAWAEKVGSATNIERRVQPLKIAVPSPGDYPNDLDVFSRLAERLGSPWPALGLAEVRKEIERAVGAYTDVFDADLANRAVFWPLAGVEEVVDTLPHGIGRADGKGLFLAPSPTGRPAAGEDEYPFILMRGHILTHLGSGSRSGRSKRLMMAVDRAVLGAAPGDMDILGLTDGALVRVASARGELVVPVQAAPELPAGVVFLPASFPEARPNVLFNGAAGEAKHCRVRLEKI